MANYGIQFNNSGSVKVPVWDSGTGLFTLNIPFTTGVLGATDGIIGMDNAATPNAHIALNSSGGFIMRMGNVLSYTSPTGLMSTSTEYRFFLERTTATACSITLFDANDNVVHAGTFSNSGSFDFNSIGSITDENLAFDGIIWQVTTTGGTQARNYLSNVNTGTVWTDIYGAQDGTLTNLAATPWVLGETVAGTITVGEAAYASKVYQRTSANNKSVSFPITYTGAPGSLQYRLLDAANDTTEITTWAVFDASPTGNVSTLTFNAPASTTAYHVQVRLDLTTDTDLQTVNWYVGAVILVCGQSLSEGLSDVGAITAPAGYRVYSGGVGAVPTTGTGGKAIADAFIGAENVAVMIINTGVGGTPLTVESGIATYWANVSSSLWTNTVSQVGNATNTDNQIEFMWWHQGTKDSLTGLVTQANYEAGLVTLFTNARSAFKNNDGGTLDILCAAFGRDTRGTATDLTHQPIRQAQITYSNTDANTSLVSTYPFENSDGVHGTDAGYAAIGEQIAATYYYVKGDTVITSPVVSTVATGATASDVDIIFNASLLLTDTTYSTEGVRVEVDGTPVTVSGFSRTNSTTATIALAAPITSGTVSVYFGYGKGSTGAALTYPRSQDISILGFGSYNITAIPAIGDSFVFGSTLNLLSTGTPDGLYTADIYNNATKTLIETKSLTFSGGGSSTTLSSNVGTETWTLIKGSNAPTTGMAYIGVTE